MSKVQGKSASLAEVLTAPEPAIPERFQQALMSLRQTPSPRGLALTEVPAPKRLAPFTAALSSKTIESTHDVPAASGRFVVLYDPNGQHSWNGDFRIVVMAQACLDNEIGSDPCLGQAAWSWLIDALMDFGAGYHCLVGTVSKVLSETFGGIDLNNGCAHAEIRASWSPNTADLSAHLQAWYALIHIFAGHEPELATSLNIPRL